MSAAPWRAAPNVRWSRWQRLRAVNEAPRQYLNRLSDLMFVLARVLNRANLDGLGGDDVYWRSERLARDNAKPTPAADQPAPARVAGRARWRRCTDSRRAAAPVPGPVLQRLRRFSDGIGRGGP